MMLETDENDLSKTQGEILVKNEQQDDGKVKRLESIESAPENGKDDVVESKEFKVDEIAVEEA